MQHLIRSAKFGVIMEYICILAYAVFQYLNPSDSFFELLNPALIAFLALNIVLLIIGSYFKPLFNERLEKLDLGLNWLLNNWYVALFILVPLVIIFQRLFSFGNDLSHSFDFFLISLIGTLPFSRLKFINTTFKQSKVALGIYTFLIYLGFILDKPEIFVFIALVFSQFYIYGYKKVKK